MVHNAEEVADQEAILSLAIRFLIRKECLTMGSEIHCVVFHPGFIDLVATVSKLVVCDNKYFTSLLDQIFKKSTREEARKLSGDTGKLSEEACKLRGTTGT